MKQIFKKCSRNNCKNAIYKKDPYARQKQLCKQHFEGYTNKYNICFYCGNFFNKKNSKYPIYCSIICSINKFDESDFLKFLEDELNYQRALKKISKESFAKMLYMILAVKNNEFLSTMKSLFLIKNDFNFVSELNEKYIKKTTFSILDLSLFQVRTLEYKYCPYYLIPSFLYKRSGSNFRNSFNVFESLKFIFRHNVKHNPCVFNIYDNINTTSVEDTFNINDFYICYSKDQQYKELPIYRLLINVMPSDDSHANIDRLKRSNMSEFQYLKIEIYSLAVLDNLVNEVGHNLNLANSIDISHNNSCSITNENDFIKYISDNFNIVLGSDNEYNEKILLGFYQSLFIN